MYMLIAVAVTALVIVLAWRGMGARTPGADQTGSTPTHKPRASRPTRTIAPDDDPEFARTRAADLRVGCT
jgi:hypothetical protein